MKKITNKLLWIFAVGQFGWSLLSGIVTNWMVYYYTGTPDAQNPNTGIFASGITQNPILFKLTLFGLVLAVGRIFDAITDPLIAGWSDRSNYKGGRRIPFMKAAAIPFALITAAVFVLPQTGSVAANNTIIFALLMLFYLFMTIYCTPYNALIAELGDTQEHRINVSTFISFTYIAGFSLATLIPSLANVFQNGKIAAILTPVAAEKGVGLDELMVMLQGGGENVVKMDQVRAMLSAETLHDILLVQQNAMRTAIGILCAVACVACLVPAVCIKERAYIDSKPVQTPAFASLVKTFRNAQFRRFVYADVIYFFAVTLFQTGLADFETRLMGIPSDNTFTLTVIMTVVSLLLYLPVNRLAPKVGKKKLIIVGFFTYAAVFLITALCGQGFIWGLIVAVSAGIPMAILGILPQACVADVSELNTLETGEDRSGMFFAARTFAMKLGQALSMVIYTSVTVKHIVNGEAVVEAGQYRTVAAIATVTCVIGACLFLLYDEKMILGRIDELKAGKKA